jgi:predicted phage-related endonuclease
MEVLLTVLDMNSEPYEEVCAQTETEKWKEARWSGFSASVIPQLLGYDSYAPPLKELIYNHARRINTVRDNGYMALGRYFERGVMDWAADVLPDFAGRHIDSWGKLLRSKAYPFILATPDGISGDDLVEVKTRTAQSSAWREGVPKKVLCQVQTQLLVTGMQRAYVIDWAYPDIKRRSEPQPPVAHRVERDDKEIARIIDAARQAYELVEVIRKQEGL